MAEDLAATLATYKVQLQQVEAALTNSPDDDELNKLKQDLLEVSYVGLVSVAIGNLKARRSM